MTVQSRTASIRVIEKELELSNRAPAIACIMLGGPQDFSIAAVISRFLFSSIGSVAVDWFNVAVKVYDQIPPSQSARFNDSPFESTI